MDEKKDIFDRLMCLPLLRKAAPFYDKHKSFLLYLFFGGLAFLVSIVTFWLFHIALWLHELLANLLSWIVTVLFAFFTNRVLVFAAPTKTVDAFLRQMGAFFAGRVLTLAIEEAILFIFVTYLLFPSLLVKIFAQIIVILLNYLISKKIVFISQR